MNKKLNSAAAWGTAMAFLSTIASVVCSQPTLAHGHQVGSGVSSVDVFCDDGHAHILLSKTDADGPKIYYEQLLSDGKTTDAIRVDKGMPAASSPHRGMDVQLAAKGKTIIAAWTTKGTDPFGSGPICTSISEDGGKTWSAGPNPADDGSTTGHTFLDIASDDAGVFHMVWLDSRSEGKRGLRYAQSQDGGKHWSANQTLDPVTCECCWNTIAVGPHNKLAVLYRDCDPRDMSVITSDDGGKTWSKAQSPKDFNWRISACPHVGGGLAYLKIPDQNRCMALVWNGVENASKGLYSLSSDNDGKSWGTPKRLGSFNSWHSDLCAGDGEQLATIWDTFGNKGIFSATTANGGKTWSHPKELTEKLVHASHPRVFFSSGSFWSLWTESPKTGDTTLKIKRF